MKNVKSFEEYVNEAYNNLFQETLTPKEAIDKATQEINHARKLDNPGLVDKITEGDKVSYEVEQGQKGLSAVKVKLE